MVKSQVVYQGIIKDHSNHPIPYATITSTDKLITIGNEDGSFYFNLPDTSGFGNLHISCIGFETKVIPLSGLHIPSSIQLISTSYLLDEVTVGNPLRNGKDKKWGSKLAKPYGRFCDHLGCGWGLEFKNDKKKNGYIKSIGFFISEKVGASAKFRARIYQLGDDGKSITLLLNKNLIVNDTLAANNWFDVDVEKYKLRLPTNGFIVLMEWLPENKEVAYEYMSKDSLQRESKTKCFGQVLAGTSEFEENLTWFLNPMGRVSKSQMNPAIKFLNTFNPMIRAVVSIE